MIKKPIFQAPAHRPKNHLQFLCHISVRQFTIDFAVVHVAVLRYIHSIPVLNSTRF
jgi:hypothetical protein